MLLYMCVRVMIFLNLQAEVLNDKESCEIKKVSFCLIVQKPGTLVF